MLKKNILIYLTALWCGCQSPPPPAAQSPAPPQSPVDSLQFIAEQLYRAGGDFTRPAPRILLSADTLHMAAWEPGAGEIWIEQRAWAVCRQFGAYAPNAMAILIGHELGHYYDEQARNTSFRAYSRQPGSNLLREHAADVQGVLLAHLAGYEVRDIVPQFLTQLYDAYGRAPNPAGYPALNERRRTAQTVSARVDTILKVFDAANMLAAVEQYEPAIAALEYLQQWYRGGEIYLNLGVLYALSAVQAQSRALPDTFVYPFTLQGRPFLGRPRAEFSAEALRQRLQKADEYLQMAAQRDPRCKALARFNRANVWLLLGQPEKALALRDEAIGDSTSKKEPWAIIEALAEAVGGNKRTALGLFQSIAQKASGPERSWALQNIAVLEGRSDAGTGCPGEPVDFATAQAAMEAAENTGQMYTVSELAGVKISWFHPPYAVLARDVAGACAIWPVEAPGASDPLTGSAGLKMTGWQMADGSGIWQYCRESGWLYRFDNQRQRTGSWRVISMR